MKGIRCLASLPMAPETISKLNDAGFRTIDDIKGLGPVALANESGITRQEALALVQQSDSSLQPAKPPSSALSLMRRAEQNTLHLSSLSKSFDSILGGGLPLQQVTEVCGTPGIGKTQLCIQFAVNAQMPTRFGGVEGDAIYIDTEGSFMIERVEDIATGTLQHMQNFAQIKQDQSLIDSANKFTVADILCRIHYYRVNGHIELVALIKSLPGVLGSLGRQAKLLVVDSIAAPFRHEFEDMRARSSMLQSISQHLAQLAAEHDLAVLLTNHVTTKMDNLQAAILPALGETWAHNPNTRIYCYWKENKRHAHLLKSAVCEKQTVLYDIDACGVRDCSIKRGRPGDCEQP